MKKLCLLFLLCIPMLTHGASVSISGEINAIPNQAYSYTRLGGLHGVSGTNAKWTVSGGKFTNGSTTLYQNVDISSVNVIWDNIYPKNGTLTYYYKNGSGEAYEGTMSVNINQNGGTGSTSQPFSSLDMSISGTLKTYNKLNLTLLYKFNNTWIGDFTVTSLTWTIDNAGEIKTLSGNPVAFYPNKTGKTVIKATIGYQFASGTETRGGTRAVTKTINLEDGSLEIPNLEQILGPTVTKNGAMDEYSVYPEYHFPNIKYNWTMDNMASILHQAKNICRIRFIWNSKVETECFISCKATNTKTGKTGNTIYTRVRVKPGTPGLNPYMASKEQYTITNIPNALLISTIENETEYIQIRSAKQISYQINNLLTGTLADQGKIINGSSIDTSKLPKGLYVLTLNDGTVTETHKISIK